MCRQSRRGGRSILNAPFYLGNPAGESAGGNAGGTANIDGTSLQTFAATAGAQPGFTTYTLPNPLTITAGDFVVGFQVPAAPGGSFPIAIDSDNPMSRSYQSGKGTAFTNVTNGNYMIRAAQVFTGCSPGATVQFTAASARVAENAGSIILTVARTGDTSGMTTVNYSTGGGTATPGQDYTPTSGQLTFAPSETSKTISVPIINDTLPALSPSLSLSEVERSRGVTSYFCDGIARLPSE